MTVPGIASHHQTANPAPMTEIPGQTITLLPVLPDPSTLWSSSGPSSAFLLQEARSNIAQIKALKEHCQSGRISESILHSAVPGLPSKTV